MKSKRAIVKTGVYAKSPSVLQARSRKVYQMVRRLIRECPWLEKSDRHALVAFCELEYLCAAIWLKLDKGASMFDAKGEVRRLAHDYRIMRQSQAMYMRDLGLTPVARQMLRASGNAPDDLVAEFARANATRPK